MKIGSLLANATDTFRLTYMPEFLLVLSTAAPAKVVVRSLGDGVTCDLDAAGVTLLNQPRFNKQVADYWLIPLADGLVTGKNIEIEITAGNAATDVDVFSNNTGRNYLISERNTVLANTSQSFKGFFFLGFSTIGANEQITAVFRDGTTQLLTASDVKMMAAQFGQDKFLFDNLDQEYSRIDVVASQQLTIYKHYLKL